MAVDKVRPLKLHDSNDDIPVPTGFNITDDYVACKGIAIEGDDDLRLESNGADKLGYRDTTTGGDAGSLTLFSDTATQADAARFTINLNHNSTVGDGTFYGPLSTIPGDTTPIIIPVDCTLFEFTWSNSSATADYTLDFRINSTVATPFYSVSKTNTQFFSDIIISQVFAQGDQIYIQHTKDGGNAADASIILYFQVNP